MPSQRYLKLYVCVCVCVCDLSDFSEVAISVQNHNIVKIPFMAVKSVLDMIR